MKAVFVGDPHATWAELEDCWGLIRCVEAAINHFNPEYVVLLGDLYHNHQTVDLEVQDFWFKALDTLKSKAKIVIITGNHDRPNNAASSGNALHAHFSQATVVVDNPVDIGHVRFIPYQYEEDRFVELAGDADVVVCHQTFVGAVFDNGVTVQHGAFDQSKIPAKTIISGHIHTPMELGNDRQKLFYVGAPRWRTVSCANTTRSLMLWDNGAVKYWPTANFCKPIYHFEDTEVSPLDVEFNPKAKYVIDLKGSPAWIESRKSLYRFARVREYPTSRKVVLKESLGIGLAMRTWAEKYVPQYQTPKKAILERFNERCPQFRISLEP